MQLRKYQEQAHNATVTFSQNGEGHGIIAACPRSGKSLLIARMAEHLHSHDCRVVCLADRGRLIEQNYGKFSNTASVGIVSTGLDRHEYDKPIVVGGIQTLYNKANKLGNVDWFLIDECNSVGNNFASDSRYHQLLRQYPDARIIGYSGTPYSLSEGAISWGKIIYEISYSELLEQGYVVPLTNKLCDTPDLSDIPHVGKEYNIEALGSYMRQSELIERTADKITLLFRANNRKKAIGFCVDIEHTVAMAMALQARGIKADIVNGLMDETQKAMHYQDYEFGDTEILLNVEIATRGMDFPCTDCIVFLRPTESMALWEQAIARGIGLFEGKTECLLLDFTGNLAKFGTLGNPIWRYFGAEKKKVGKAQKVCPACESAINIGRETCPDCGYIFLKEDIEKELKHDAEADLKSDMSKAKSAERIYSIGYINYTEHTSPAGNKSLKVTYHSGKFTCYDFIPFSNQLFWARKKVQNFMKGRSNVIPTTLEAALKLAPTWRKPKVMKFKPQAGNPKYFEVEAVLEWQE